MRTGFGWEGKGRCGSFTPPQTPLGDPYPLTGITNWDLLLREGEGCREGKERRGGADRGGNGRKREWRDPV